MLTGHNWNSFTRPYVKGWKHCVLYSRTAVVLDFPVTAKTKKYHIFPLVTHARDVTCSDFNAKTSIKNKLWFRFLSHFLFYGNFHASTCFNELWIPFFWRCLSLIHHEKFSSVFSLRCLHVLIYYVTLLLAVSSVLLSMSYLLTSFIMSSCRLGENNAATGYNTIDKTRAGFSRLSLVWLWKSSVLRKFDYSGPL
jgi:hypothetical protein